MTEIANVRVKLIKENTSLYSINRVTDHDTATNIASTFLENYGADREIFCSMLLNAKKNVIGINVVSIGSLKVSIVHPREVFKAAILANADSLILFHNHPSGDCRPSQEDLDVTNSLVRAGHILGISVVDHIILGDGTGETISLKANNFF